MSTLSIHEGDHLFNGAVAFVGGFSAAQGLSAIVSDALRVINVKDAPFNAVGNGTTDDTQSIQAAMLWAVALGNGCNVVIPHGIYLVGEGVPAGNGAIEIGTLGETANVKVSGDGTLKLADGSAADAVLQLEGDHISVHGIRIDGNESGAPTGRGEGLRVNGSYCSAFGVYASNTTVASAAASTFFINSAAVGTLLEGCISFESGEAAVSNRGDFTTIRDFRALEFQGHAFGNGGGNRQQLTVDGWYAKSSVTDKTGFLLDLGVSGSDGFILEHANLSNIIVDCGDSATFGNGVKIARVRNVNIDKMQVLHTSNAFHSLRFAEGVGNVRIKDSHFSNDIYQEDGAFDDVGSISAAADNGSGFARFTSASHGLKTGDTIIVTGTTSYNGVHRVTASAAPGNMFDTDWRFIANESGTFAIGMESLVIEDVTIGTIGQDAAQDALDNIKAHRISLQNVRCANFNTVGIDLSDPAKFPVAGYKSIAVKDCDFIANAPETQTIAISGTPTGGSFTITFNGNTTGSISHTTGTPATAGVVQTALRLLAGLSDCTVSQSGTGTNLTYTVTLTGFPGQNPPQMTSTSSLTGGVPVITHATSTTSTFAFRSTNTAFDQPNVVTWERNNLRSIGAGTLFITQTTTLPYLVREKGLRRNFLTANTTLTSDQSGTLFIVMAPDLVITLPPVTSAATGGSGLDFKFVLAAAALSTGTGLQISPNSNDKIIGNGFTPADNKDVILDGATDREGDSIALVSDGVDGWYITSLTNPTAWIRQA